MKPFFIFILIFSCALIMPMDYVFFEKTKRNIIAQLKNIPTNQIGNFFNELILFPDSKKNDLHNTFYKRQILYSIAGISNLMAGVQKAKIPDEIMNYIGSLMIKPCYDDLWVDSYTWDPTVWTEERFPKFNTYLRKTKRLVTICPPRILLRTHTSNSDDHFSDSDIDPFFNTLDIQSIVLGKEVAYNSPNAGCIQSIEKRGEKFVATFFSPQKALQGETALTTKEFTIPTSQNSFDEALILLIEQSMRHRNIEEYKSYNPFNINIPYKIQRHYAGGNRSPYDIKQIFKALEIAGSLSPEGVKQYIAIITKYSKSKRKLLLTHKEFLLIQKATNAEMLPFFLSLGFKKPGSNKMACITKFS